MRYKGITPKEKNYSQWYLDIVQQAGLAENSDVQGCMIIKPYGYSIWEKIRDYLDSEFKNTGHKNAYFPLLIPMEYFAKEAEHVEGFAAECAVVTHTRLKFKNNKLEVDPTSKLEQPLIVRPTSETIIWNTYRNWIQSYRDLPILINQWANVVRMEMRTRPFLRTTEFLWQEGHTAHASSEDGMEETMKILEVYSKFSENILAIPVIKGIKTPNERFAGAVETFCIEALMQDGKALQMGTSHFLGQNFAKAFDVKFTNAQGEKEYVFATSWGVSTRLIGGLIMSHSDNFGLVLPPKIAPIQVIIIPIFNNSENGDSILSTAFQIKDTLIQFGITTHVDDRTNFIPKEKFIEAELSGIPIRVELGQKELDKSIVTIFRRDEMKRQEVKISNISTIVKTLLKDIQVSLYKKAITFRESKTQIADTLEEFKMKIEMGGFVYAHWDGTSQTEQEIKNATKATIRCIPINNKLVEGKCILTGKHSRQRVLFAKSY